MKIAILWAQGLISGKHEYDELIHKWAKKKIDFHFPYWPEFPSSHHRWHVVQDLVQGLKWYLDQNINPSDKLVLYGNSMGTHIINTLWNQYEDVRERTIWYVDVSGCSFGVEHGNASFREFTSKIDVNPERQGLYAINEIFAKIMKCTTFEDVLQLIKVVDEEYTQEHNKQLFTKIGEVIHRMKSVNHFIMSWKSISEKLSTTGELFTTFIQWDMIDFLRGEILKFAIAQSIGLSRWELSHTMVQDTKNVLWSLDNHHNRIPNTSIGTLASQLPRKKSDYEKSAIILQDIYNHGVTSFIAWSPFDPMTKRQNLEKVKDITWWILVPYKQWGHAVHISKQRDEFFKDLFWFIDWLS